jgi:hypothetical protein
MTPPVNEFWPGLLAAYADGELDAAGRACVEAWLAADPRRHAQLDAQLALSRRNRRLWRAVAAPEPTEAAWSAVLARVASGATAVAAVPAPALRRLPATPRSRRATPRGFSRSLLPFLSAAAAAILALGVLPRPGLTPLPSENVVLPVSLPGPGEVEVESVRDADRDLLIVGRPEQHPFVLATADDVVIGLLVPRDGTEPRVPMAGPDTPMVLAVAHRPGR